MTEIPTKPLYLVTLLSSAMALFACENGTMEAIQPLSDAGRPRLDGGGGSDGSLGQDAGRSDGSVDQDAGRSDGSLGQDAGGSDAGTGAPPIVSSVRNYIFGHSLLLHSQTANVPRWLAALSSEAGYEYGMSGQYGFADTHADNLPPDPQWGITGVRSLWDDDSDDRFTDINFNTVLFTAANFRQYYPADTTDPDVELPSIVSSTTRVFDWVEVAEPGVRYVIYEGWPDMAPFTDANFLSTFPSEEELGRYHTHTRDEFHDWWVDYQDAMLASRPALQVRLVPVGSLIARLLMGMLSDVPASVLYEDDAPHGQPTLYFLAGLITYMALYGVEAPRDYAVPQSIDPGVRAHYEEIISFVWQELGTFRTEGGDSRVF